MPGTSFFRYFNLSSLSTPKNQRIVYKTLRQCRAERILEIGLTDTAHTQRIIEVALKFAAGPVEYTGIGPFESVQQDGVSLSLKATYQSLRKLGSRVRLIPGSPAATLARYANMIQDIDLLVVRASFSADDMDRGWFYVPRMLRAGSLTLVEEAGPAAKTVVRLLTHADIVKKANAAAPRRTAAA